MSTTVTDAQALTGIDSFRWDRQVGDQPALNEGHKQCGHSSSYSWYPTYRLPLTCIARWCTEIPRQCWYKS